MKTILALAAPALVAVVSLSGIATAYSAGIVTVAQRARAFAVPSVQVSRGDTVRFLNEDAFLHQVYVDGPAFKFESPEQEPGQNVDMRFPQAGTFTVLCHIHPKMTLQVEAR